MTRAERGGGREREGKKRRLGCCHRQTGEAWHRRGSRRSIGQLCGGGLAGTFAWETCGWTPKVGGEGGGGLEHPTMPSAKEKFLAEGTKTKKFALASPEIYGKEWWEGGRGGWKGTPAQLSSSRQLNCVELLLATVEKKGQKFSSHIRWPPPPPSGPCVSGNSTKVDSGLQKPMIIQM